MSFPSSIADSYHDFSLEALSRSMAEMVLDDKRSNSILSTTAMPVVQCPPSSLKHSESGVITNNATAMLHSRVAEMVLSENPPTSVAQSVSCTSTLPVVANRIHHTVVPEKDEKEALRITQSCRCVRVIERVHNGNIHAIVKLVDGFVTGGQDGRLIKWSDEGKLLKRIWEPSRYNASWITALGILDQERWLSGTGNGWIHQWGQKNEYFHQATGPCSLHDLGYDANVRNAHRILCFLPKDDGKGFLCGRRSRISIHTSQNVLAGWLSLPDDEWAFAMHSLGGGNFVAAIGPELVWFKPVLPEKGPNKYRRTVLLTVQNNISQAERNEFVISSMTPLPANTNHFGVGLFNGSLKIYDCAQRKIFWNSNEHQSRIWAIENLTRDVFASAGDGLIKLWDLRQAPQACVTMIPQGKGRVTALVKTADTQFVSGSSSYGASSDVVAKARLSFWDLRKT